LATENDDFPYQSADPDLKPAQIQTVSKVEIDTAEYQDLKMLVRLLIGSAAEGSDEFSRRARLWQAELDRSDPSKMVIPENETEAARLRYTLIGFLFGAVDAGYNSLSLFDKVASTAITTVSFIFSPLTHSRLWRPVRNNFELSRERGESIVNSWMETGRREEQASRYLVRQQAYEEVIDDAIEYLAHKPEVSDLIQQQSVGMAEEIINDLRERSSKYDFLLDERVQKLLRKQPKKPPAA
jgi:hypothetical protein